MVTRRSAHSVLLACVATFLLHLPFLTSPLGTDEGGFAMVARYWRESGPYLYGPQWVDRPPGLFVVFEAANGLGPYGVRLMAAVLAVVMVAAVAWAAATVGGPSAARWSAWTAFALASSVLLDAEALNGELIAASLVAVGVATLLASVRRAGSPGARLALAGVSGTAAAGAFLVKQNFVDVFVFAGVLLALGLATRQNRSVTPPRELLGVAGGFTAGAAVPVLVTLGWAARRGSVTDLGYAVFGFRADAAAVMASWSWAAPLARLQALALVGLVSGVFLLLAHLLRHHHRRLFRAAPLAWAITLTVAWQITAIAVGANFWRHYLIALVPLVALATGLAAGQRRPGPRMTHALVVLACFVTVVAVPVQLARQTGSAGQAYATGRWLADAAQPGDTVVVPFTHANVIEASGLRPGYPYAWSLPVRTLDPDLDLLVATLRAQDAPTWVVRWDNPNSWDIDPVGRVQAALLAHYRMVAEVCGKPVWLLDGARRDVPELPDTAVCVAAG